MLLLILQPKNYLYFILVLCPFVTICTYCIAYCYCIVYTCLCKYLIGLIWYLMPLSTIFQLYCGGKLKTIKKIKKKKIIIMEYGIQILSKQKKQHMVQRLLYIFHYISWACFFNPQRGIACFLSQNTLYSGNPRYVVDCRGNPSRKTRQHSMDWYTAHVYFVQSF